MLVSRTTVRSAMPSRARVSFRHASLLVGVSATALLLGSLSGAQARGLQGSTPVTNAAAFAAASAQANAAQAAATASQAMIRAAGSMQGMRSIQAAARAAALAAGSSVPNGLTPDGLVVAPGAVPGKTDGGTGLWQGANLPTQTAVGGRTQVEIVQNEAKSILTWDKFNIGRETDLRINQSAGGANAANWISLNRVLDSSTAPSQILGTIKAEGQVYVINRNGIVFGGSSQVNVHTLVASSLSLSNAQFMAGINKPLNIPDGSSNSWGLPTFGDSTTDTNSTTALPNYGTTPGDVTVNVGAQIDSLVGGKAMLFAPRVTNAGTIRTPGGQAIFAAGENVWLADPVLTNATNKVRGLDVAVSSPTAFVLQYQNVAGQVAGWWETPEYQAAFAGIEARAASVGYKVTNTGVVEAARGNITVTAREINQNGALLASTALNNQDGSIILRAWGQGLFAYAGEFSSGSSLYWWSSGTVTLGGNSVTMVVPDLTDTGSIELGAVAARYTAGSIDLRGNLIDIQAGATVVAPSGTITAVAQKLPRPELSSAPTSPEISNDGSRIYIGEGALLSVAGLRDVMLSMESNSVKAELRINELRDSVLYIDSWLRGATVYVDKRVTGTFTDGPMAGVIWGGTAGQWSGTPLADVSAWIGTGSTNLAELSTTGGKITLKSGGDVIIRAGATLDVAGGSVRYADGYITTTRLLGADGRIYDIGAATPDQQYSPVGSFSRYHARINVTETWNSILDRNGGTRFEQGYTEGRKAGAIVIFNGAGLAMEGEVDGHVITGERQAASGKVATAGLLQIGGGNINTDYKWLSSNITITRDPVRLAAGFDATTALPSDFFDISTGTTAERSKTTYLSDAMLNRSGLGTVSLFYNNTATIAADADLQLSPGATLTIAKVGNADNIATTNVVVNGSVRIAGGTISLGADNGITLGSGAVLDVSGRWVNEFATGIPVDAPKINGGSVTLDIDPDAAKKGVTGEVRIVSGAVIDVSGGGWLQNKGNKQKLQVGDAGAIKLSNVVGGLSGLDLRAFAAGSGGTFSVSTAGDVQIGGAMPTDTSILYLPPTLLAEKGFRSVTIIAAGNVTFPDGATVSQTPVNVDLLGSDLMSSATGSKITDLGQVRVLDLTDRVTRKSTSLSITSPSIIKLGTGASLSTEVKGRIVFSEGTDLSGSALGTGSIIINGAIDAPSGSIAIDAQILNIGGTARLTSRGTAVIAVDPTTGLRTGTVLDGGSVTLTGAMTLGPDVVIDVSGTSGVIDDPQRPRGSDATVTLASNGGVVSLTGGKSATSTVDARIFAKAGGAGASGGTLSIASLPLVLSEGSSQNPLTTNFFGYFKEVGAGGKYDYDPATGAFAANPTSGRYNFVGGTTGFDPSTAGVINLDVYGEYDPATPYILSDDMKTAINALGPISGAATLIVNGLAQNAPVSPSVQPWQVNAAIEEKAVTLLNKYFYTSTRTGRGQANWVYTPIEKIEIKGVVPVSDTVSANVINNGGFGGVNLPAMRMADGVNLNLQGAAVTINVGISALTDGASASINAAYIGLIPLSVSGAGTISNSLMTGGTLTLNAGLIDVSSATFRGYANTTLVAGDLRLTGFDVTNSASLTSDGTLKLQAAQVYPTTRTKALIAAGDRIVVLPNGASETPLSAGGDLTLKAPDIDIAGTVRAPFGSLTLAATRSVTLGAGALISVSGDGLTVPYGVLYNDGWALETPNGVPVSISMPPEKKITLDAPSVNVAAGSVIDIRGGGNLRASEFVVGSGGSHDVLTMSGTYAIMPSYGSSVAPGKTGVAAGGRIWLGGGNGLAAGWYTLLPAQYALLPGAFAVQVVAGSAGKSYDRPLTLADGTVLMAGRLGNSFDGSAASQASNFRVMSGDVVRKYSEYNEADANTYFASDAFRLTQYRLTGLDIVASRMPMDGGSVVFKALTDLTLDGQLKSAAADGGRAGLVDIAATNIAVIGAGQDRSGLAGYLIIDSARLSSFGAASLLIGGVRTSTTAGLGVDVSAQSIVVRNDGSSALVGPEIILTAVDNINIGAGSVLRAEGTVTGGSGNLIMKPQIAANPADNGTPTDPNDDHTAIPASDYGALIRLSNGDIANVVRTNVDNTSPHGNVSIAAGAVLSGGKALLIDATRTATLAGSAQVSATDITLSGSSIGFGGGTGLVFDAASLAQFNSAQNLTLRSYSTIDFYNGIDFGSAGLKSVTFDATGLIGRSGAPTSVTGQTLTLRNTVGTLVDPLVAEQGTLTLNIDRLVLGSGAKSLRGFNTVAVSAADRVVGNDTGSLDAGTANLSIVTPLITALNGASQSITTGGVLAVASSGGAAARDAESLGSRWAFNARQIDFGGRIAAVGGTVAMSATGGNVMLMDGAAIDVGGIGKAFNDVTAYANAGTISLTSVGGSVIAHAGSTMNLAAAAGGGDAGTLSAIASGGGAVVLGGAIDAHAAAGKGGSFALDIGALPDFAGFSQRLDMAGFNRSRQFRIRTGDVALDGTTVVENFVLSTDAGRVTISGSIDASAAYGGNIAISGGNGITMGAGANLVARSTTALGSGRVTLEAAGGRLNVTGGVIDVSGGELGKVRFRALQNASHDEVAVDNLQVDIRGARSSVLQAVASYTSTDGTVESVWSDAVTDAAKFMTAAPGIATGIAAGIDVMAGIEIRSAGDLTLSTTLDLARAFAGHQGSLTLRAGNNLALNDTISDGFSDATREGALLAQDSWDLRLVAGADLGSSDALAAKPFAGLATGSGKLTIGDASNGYMVRTGTGDLAVRAAGNIDLAHFQSVIYTAGRKDISVYADFSAPVNAEYGIQGGNLSIHAGGGISSTLPTDNEDNMLFTKWLMKQGVVNNGFVFIEDPTDHSTNQSTWWIKYSGFTQGVGALGGGNVNVQAGTDLENLLVALADNGRVHGGTVTADDKVLQTSNGGMMNVVAGGAVKAGSYYIARVAATIDAGTFANGRTVNLIDTITGNPIVTRYDIAPVLALGDASATVRTAGDLRLQTVLDPLMTSAHYDYGQVPDDRERIQTFILGQTANTQLNLTSVGGNVTLVNQARVLAMDVTVSGTGDNNNMTDLIWLNSYAGNLYPAQTRIAALNGSIVNLDQLVVLPAARGSLTMLAAQDVTTGNILMTRATPDMLPSPFHPVGGGNGVPGLQYNTGGSTRSEQFTNLLLNNRYEDIQYSADRAFDPYLKDAGNPADMVNAGDFEPSRIYALNGSLRAGSIVANEQTWLSAGIDVRDVTLNLRNLHATDVSWVNAGNDYLNHNLDAKILPSIVIQGPGAVLVTAGRDVYADQLGIYSIGNRNYYNRDVGGVLTAIKGLPEVGASIDVMAGLNGQQPNYAAVASTYLDPSSVGGMPSYLTTTVNGQLLPLYLTDELRVTDGISKQTRTGIVSFVKDMTGETLAPLDAWARFQTLPALTQQRFLRQVYMQELREAGRDQNTLDANAQPINGGYNRGYAAIAALFPGDAWKGDVQSGNALLRTAFGGDIGVYTPGGGLQIAALNQAVAPNYGVITLGYGQINIAAKKNVVVNRSRVLTFGGGDVTIWSTLGDIDAGRGAKTTRVASAPTIKTDEDGVTRVIESSGIDGSGIGTVIGFAGVEAGDVDLIAPGGTVNAGDAGIRVAGNFNVAALFVLNADNIKVGGDSKGVPKAEAPAVSLSLETKDKSAADAVKDATQQTASERPSVIIVEVLGYGGGSAPGAVDDEEERRKKDDRRTQGQDPDSPTRVVGYGPLTEPQKRLLSDAERRNL
jgi:filamentous hemagglutinin